MKFVASGSNAQTLLKASPMTADKPPQRVAIKGSAIYELLILLQNKEVIGEILLARRDWGKMTVIQKEAPMELCQVFLPRSLIRKQIEDAFDLCGLSRDFVRLVNGVMRQEGFRVFPEQRAKGNGLDWSEFA